MGPYLAKINKELDDLIKKEQLLDNQKEIKGSNNIQIKEILEQIKTNEIGDFSFIQDLINSLKRG